MAVPWAAIGQAALGIGQSIFGGGKARRAQKELEGMVNNYKPNQSILDYYTKALNKYNANPYQGAGYQAANQFAQRGVASGINALQDRRSALAGVGGLVQGANDANLKAVAQAENQQSQDLAQLGQATQMKDREDKYKFENKYNLLSMKAGAANQTANAGISNLFGGLGGITDYAMINKMYGGGGNGGSKTSPYSIGGYNNGSTGYVPTRPQYEI